MAFPSGGNRVVHSSLIRLYLRCCVGYDESADFSAGDDIHVRSYCSEGVVGLTLTFFINHGFKTRNLDGMLIFEATNGGCSISMSS